MRLDSHCNNRGYLRNDSVISLRYWVIMKKFAYIVFWCSLVVSVCLLIVGFILPPLGQIDQSVIKAVGELFSFAVLGQIPSIVQIWRDGGKVNITHGDTSIEFSRENENEKTN